MTAKAVKQLFEFVPRRDVVRVFRYLFAVAVKRFGMEVHEALCMSNHFHLLMTDVYGTLPKFMEYFDSLLARSLNAMRGAKGTVLEKGYNIVIATDEEAVIGHAVYTLANPCKSHLVRRSRHWPGFSTLKMRYGQTIEIEQPKVGLWRRGLEKAKRGKRRRTLAPNQAGHRHKRSRMPESVTLTLVRPPVAMKLSDDELREQVWKLLDAEELELIGERRSKGTDVLGVDEVLAQSPRSYPSTTTEMFGTVPGVSGRSKWARIEALQRRRDFEEAYAEVRTAFLDGNREVVWPAGTWLMRVRYGLPCCEVGPPMQVG